MEKVLGVGVETLVQHNIKKWALQRSSLSEHIDGYTLNRLILKCVIKEAQDGEKILNGPIEGYYLPIKGKIKYKFPQKAE